MRLKWLIATAVIALAACGGGGGSGGAPAPGPIAGPPVPPPPPPPPPPPSQPASQWPGFVSNRMEQLFELDPAFAVYQGRHDFDGRLPDWSDAGLAQTIAFWHATIDQANTFIGLDATQQFERDYLVQIARGQLFFYEDMDAPHTNPTFYIGGGLDPNVYLAREYAGLPVRMRAATDFLKAIPAAAASIRANLKMPMPATFISYAVSAFNGFADSYATDVPAVFAGVGDPALQQEMAAAASAASAAMRDLAKWMSANAGSATQNFALGSAKFSRMLSAVEMVDTPLAELQQLGQADLKSNQNEVAAACAQYAPGLSIGGCLGRLASNLPADGSVAAATRQIDELRAFVVAQDLVTIPGNEQVLVRESPPYNRSNPAYIDPPGPYETGIPSIYYIAPNSSMSEASLLFTSVHEAMPGHFVQFLHSNRSPSLVGRLLVTGGFAEGWAHYSEQMMWEAGLRGTPEAHLGYLVNALLRDCRFLAAIGMHTQGMTFAEAQALFQQQCYQGAATAQQQAARGTSDPGYLNYTMDKLMILKLRNDWTATRGGRAAWKDFHDQFLSYGGPPVPLVRAAMMGGAPKAVF